MNGEAIAYSSLAMRNRSDKRTTVIKNANEFLIIQGKYDPLISPEKMREELKSDEVKTMVFENSGHMAHFEETQRLKEVLSDFFA
jgi:pimeloyl-ACP methyl ester carboxylesterase